MAQVKQQAVRDAILDSVLRLFRRQRYGGTTLSFKHKRLRIFPDFAGKMRFAFGEQPDNSLAPYIFWFFACLAGGGVLPLVASMPT